MTRVVIDLRPTAAAFFDVRPSVGDTVLDLHGLADEPLEDMVTVALALARGKEPSLLSWDPEDGSLYRWYIRHTKDRLRLTINRVDAQTGRGSGRARDGSDRVFDAQCSVDEFCLAVLDGSTRVIERYGRVRFEELSSGPFPVELVNDLQAALGAPGPAGTDNV